MLHRLFTRRPKLWAEFQDMVRTHFRFLEDEYGAVCHAEHPVVLYQLPSVTVEVYGEFRQFFETGVTFHEHGVAPVGEQTVPARKIPLEALVVWSGFDTGFPPLIHTRREIDDELALSSLWMRRHATALLEGGHRVHDPAWTPREHWRRLIDDLAQGRAVWRSAQYVGQLRHADGPFAGEPTFYARELDAFERAGYRRMGEVFLPASASRAKGELLPASDPQAIDRAMARRKKSGFTPNAASPTPAEVETIEEICHMVNRQEALLRLASTYLAGGLQLRRYIHQHWPLGVDWRYPNPYRLACADEEGTPSKERALALLVYLGLMELTPSSRPSMRMLMAMAHHSLQWIGEDAREVFWHLSSLTPTGSNSLGVFFRGSPDSLTLDAYFLKEIRNSDGEREIVSIDDWN
jgi:hypothetical protein